LIIYSAPITIHKSFRVCIYEYRRSGFFNYLVEILQSLGLSFGTDKLPFDDALRGRLDWAKVIGLAFFYNPQGDCWDGNVCVEDRRRTIAQLFDLFVGLVDLSMPSALQMLVELGTQVYIMTLHVKSISSKNGNANAEFEKRLGQRIEQVKDARIMNEPTEERFPFSGFARSLMGFLRNLYDDIEPPIIAKVTFIDGDGYNNANHLG